LNSGLLERASRGPAGAGVVISLYAVTGRQCAHAGTAHVDVGACFSLQYHLDRGRTLSTHCTPKSDFEHDFAVFMTDF
jgi:hypothetical protein